MGKRILAFPIVSSQISVGVTTTAQRCPVEAPAAWEHDVGENGGAEKAGQCQKDPSEGRGGEGQRCRKKVAEAAIKAKAQRVGARVGGGCAFLPMLT